MILLLGLAGIIQAVFLPGYILVKRYARKIDLPLLIVLSFSLSLLINSLVVLFLCGLNIYTQPIMIPIFIIELFLCLRPNRFADVLRPRISLRKALDNCFAELTREPLVFTGKLVFVYAFIQAFRYCINRVGYIFTAWDAVVVWHRFAMEIFHNDFPDAGWAWNYPKLVPALMSLPYVFMNDPTIQFFSHALLTLYFPVGVLAIYCVFKTRNYFPALMCLAAIVWYFPENFIGYLDFPLAVAILCSLSLLFVWRERATVDSPDSFILFSSMSAAATAAWTKQPGLLLVFAFPFLLREFSIAKRDVLRKVRWLYPISGCILLVAVSWYIFMHCNIIFGGVNYVSATRILEQYRLLYRSGSLVVELVLNSWNVAPVFCVMAMLSLPAILIKRARIITGVGILWALIWMVFFAIDSRNTAFAIPLLGFSVGYVVEIISKPLWGMLVIIFRFMSRRKSLAVLGIIALCIPIFFSSTLHSAIVRKQHNRSLMIGRGAHFNMQMLAAMQKEPLILVSGYALIPYISGFPADRYIQTRMITRKEDIVPMAQILNKLGKAYLLVITTEIPNLKELFLHAPGKYDLLFQDKGAQFLKFTRNPGAGGK